MSPNRLNHYNFLGVSQCKDEFVFCNNIFAMGLQNSDLNYLRLLVDSSKHSLKYVLSHNDNELVSLFIAHSTQTKKRIPYDGLSFGENN